MDKLVTKNNCTCYTLISATNGPLVVSRSLAWQPQKGKRKGRERGREGGASKRDGKSPKRSQVQHHSDHQ